MNDYQPNVGDFLSCLLVTDTRVYEVVATTEKTITVRETDDGDRTWRDPLVDQGASPVILTEQVVGEDNPTRVMRRRKDGTYRIDNGGYPLRPCRQCEGVPVRRTDYRF